MKIQIFLCSILFYGAILAQRLPVYGAQYRILETHTDPPSTKSYIASVVLAITEDQSDREYYLNVPLQSRMLSSTCA